MPALSIPAMTSASAADAFTALLREHGGIIHKVALGYTSSFADRQDLSQEITLQLWRAYPRYSSDRPFSTWMYRVALNVAISHLRRNYHPERVTLPLNETSAELASEPAPDDERVTLLRQVIAAFPPLDRGLLLLYLDEHSHREIAAILGLTETNVATKLSRLKQRLREEMLRQQKAQS
jgi:RNA polymerase sigma factor (sigma-70 family)